MLRLIENERSVSPSACATNRYVPVGSSPESKRMLARPQLRLERRGEAHRLHCDRDHRDRMVGMAWPSGTVLGS